MIVLTNDYLSYCFYHHQEFPRTSPKRRRGLIRIINEWTADGSQPILRQVSMRKVGDRVLPPTPYLCPALQGETGTGTRSCLTGQRQSVVGLPKDPASGLTRLSLCSGKQRALGAKLSTAPQNFWAGDTQTDRPTIPGTLAWTGKWEGRGGPSESGVQAPGKRCQEQDQFLVFKKVLGTTQRLGSYN